MIELGTHLKRIVRVSAVALGIAVAGIVSVPQSMAAKATGMPVPQVIVLDSQIDGLLISMKDVMETLRTAGFVGGASDLKSRIEQFRAPFGDMSTLATLDSTVQEYGFSSYEQWVRVAISVLLTENWISEPPNAAGFEDAIASLKGDPFMNDRERAQVISALRRTLTSEQPRPLSVNVETVRPHVSRIRQVLGVERR